MKPAWVVARVRHKRIVPVRTPGRMGGAPGATDSTMTRRQPNGACGTGGGRDAIHRVALIATERLSLLPDGRLLYRLKRRWRDGTCRIVEFKFFGGLNTEETAEELDISTATVEREWRSAKAWLYQSMTKGTS